MGNSKWCSLYQIFKLDPAFIAGQMRAESSQNSPISNDKRTTRRPKTPHLHTRIAHVKIPKGLIGAKYTASVLNDGQASPCLLDTGSQVITVSQSFYESNLSGFDIHPLSELLEIEAANGKTLPYSGFKEVDITFPQDCFGSEITVSNMAPVLVLRQTLRRLRPLKPGQVQETLKNYVHFWGLPDITDALFKIFQK